VNIKCKHCEGRRIVDIPVFRGNAPPTRCCSSGVGQFSMREHGSLRQWTETVCEAPSDDGQRRSLFQTSTVVAIILGHYLFCSSVIIQFQEQKCSSISFPCS
jgi:hypothetical protein